MVTPILSKKDGDIQILNSTSCNLRKLNSQGDEVVVKVVAKTHPKVKYNLVNFYFNVS